MFSEAVDEDLFKDYSKDKEDDIKLTSDQVQRNIYYIYCLNFIVLLRNMITGEKVAAKKSHILRRISVELPWKSVRNSCIYIKEIIWLIQKVLELEDIQVKDYRSLITDMFEKDTASRFYIPPPPPQNEANNEDRDYSDNYEKKKEVEDSPQEEEEEENKCGFTTASSFKRGNSNSKTSGNLGMFQSATKLKKSNVSNKKEEKHEDTKQQDDDIEIENTEECTEMSHSQETKQKDKLSALEDILKLISATKSDNWDIDLTDTSVIKSYIESNEQYCAFLDSYYSFLSTINPVIVKPIIKRKQKDNVEKDVSKKFKIKVKTSVDWSKA